MGWIGVGITKCETPDEVWEAWNSIHEELPARVADENSMRKIGVFTSEKEARAAIERLDRHDISGLVYAEVRNGKESSKLRNAKELLEKEQKKLSDFLVESSVYKTHHGKTVGCQKCGSSFPVDYFRRYKTSFGWENSGYWYSDILYDDEGEYINRCPICGAGMRSETATKRINGYKKNIDEYSNRVRSIRETEKSNPFFLYKVEAYCG